MKTLVRRCAMIAVLASFTAFGWQQQGGRTGGRGGTGEDEVLLPNGKSQREEILKAEHAQNMKDAADLADLAQQLKLDLEKNDRYVLSVATLKKTEEIEKIAKRIRSRLHH